MASVVWTTVFIFLIVELLVTFVLVIPVPRFVRNKIARTVFRFNLGDSFAKSIWFVAIALIFALVDCYFHVQRLQEKLLTMEDQDAMTGHHHSHHADKQKLYKAERNMYLAGFSLTLLFVIGRITRLMQECVELEDECERIRLPKPAISVAGDDGVEMKEIPKKPQDKKKD
jgi:B-cell receptor-associated protein 31